ncbi:hypothetical protein EDEG_02680 [Edhazardia aedis USNM 41457]|uniref:Flavodoxin-like domain-containing protein n=1 Tax=Edhazardia aedis (strain USNM 41457) TaxID=1003232 RepID=J9DJW9_EDHAE|nr:hypothetical protein EDEG_02680 [Edhazardia aedis USNM 41457]|eukprot:EJW02915.1 hypothetical protein EDEG_02680 [Edhazardia aedis USNM 41457]
MILILYGSQTGNSRTIAELIEKSFRYGFNEQTAYNISNENNNNCNEISIYAQEMDKFDFKKFPQLKYVIFVCPTYGDGDEPFNMRNLWMFLKHKELPSFFLENLYFAVFGLGDSSFVKFNFCAKKLFNRIKMLGANNIIERGDGDMQDENGYFTEFLPWLKKLHDKFSEMKDSLNFQENYKLCKNELNFEYEPIYRAKLIKKEYVTPSDYDNKILHCVFELEKERNFYPGDCLSIKPINYNHKDFISHNQYLFDISYSDFISFCKDSKYENFIQIANNINYKDIAYLIVKDELDFNFLPYQHIFLYLLDYIKQNPDKITIPNHLSFDLIAKTLKNLYFDYDSYYLYILKPKRTFYEVLKEFDVQISLQFLLKYIPKICNRYFTTAFIDGKYHLYISLVNYSTNMTIPRKGLFSEYIKLVNIGDEMNVTFGRSNLFFENRKMLFFVTGTGFTLPLAVCHHLKNKDIMVFYGFRYKGIDRILNDTLPAGKSIYNHNSINITEVNSRENGRKYVQDIYKNTPIQNIDQYSIYVCGRTELNKSLRKVLKEVHGKSINFQSETW